MLPGYHTFSLPCRRVLSRGNRSSASVQLIVRTGNLTYRMLLSKYSCSKGCWPDTTTSIYDWLPDLKQLPRLAIRRLSEFVCALDERNREGLYLVLGTWVLISPEALISMYLKTFRLVSASGG